MLKSNKRGIAITFNWIFSLVAGVLIFSFLVFFAVQNTDLFGNVTARIAAEELDLLFSGYETAQTKSSLDFDKEIELGFECRNGKQRFEVNGKAGKTVWDKIIFAPDKIDNYKINVASAPWKIPFRAANFIYIWDKKYDIKEEYETGIKLIDELKGTSNNRIAIKSYIDPKDCAGSGFANDASVKTIFYYKNEEKGYVCFNGKNDQPVIFFGEAMLVGAVLSDKNNFICSKDLAESKLKIMRRVFENKKDNLLSSNIPCDNTAYVTFVNRMPNSINSIYDSLAILKDRNLELINGGCASVY